MIFFSMSPSLQNFLHKEIQLIIAEIIYGNSIAIYLLFCSLFFEAWSEGMFRTMREIVYENNVVVMRIGYHLRKLQRVIMTNYRRIKFCNFEITWKYPMKQNTNTIKDIIPHHIFTEKVQVEIYLSLIKDQTKNQ